MITCHQSDFIEIACMYRIPVSLHWPDGRRLEGVPLDTGYDDQRRETLRMRLAGRGEQWVVIDGASEMVALKPNPHFERVRFGSS